MLHQEAERALPEGRGRNSVLEGGFCRSLGLASYGTFGVYGPQHDIWGMSIDEKLAYMSPFF